MQHTVDKKDNSKPFDETALGLPPLYKFLTRDLLTRR